MTDTTHTPPARVLVCLDEGPAAQQVIREAARSATEMRAELFALHVSMPGSSTRRSPEASAQLERNLRLAHDLGAQVELLTDHRLVDSILQFARAHAITQIVMGASRRSGWRRWFGGDPVERVRRGCGSAELRVVG